MRQESVVPRPVFDIAVVTSCHNYGAYLREWAESITRLDTWPAVVAMVDNGSTDASPKLMEEAAEILRGAGLPDVRTLRIPRTDFGSARNAAVVLGDGPAWVMHFDADDVFLPHCLTDVAELADRADVIPLGYQRFGDLFAGPLNRTRVYSDSRGASTLKSTAPASGVSPFRRSFWERSPYRTDMAGGWDTALWIGFAHLDARFVAVRRPAFLYRQHADSIFNTRRVNARASRWVGARLMDLRRKRSGVSVLVPRQSDGGGARDESWEFVRARYAAVHPEYEVVEGYASGPVWRKGEAVRDALEKSRGQTVIVADSDIVLPAQALRDAVRLVESRAVPWVVTHTSVKRLTEEETRRVLTERILSPPYREEFAREPYVGFAGGGCFVVDASVLAASGGIPRTFEGWGAEDEALAVILDTLAGPHYRLPYDLWHLWHPPAHKEHLGRTTVNRSLLRLIRSLSGDPDALFDLTQRMASGVSAEDIIRTGGRGGGGVPMVALVDFMSGSEVVKRGHVFLVTEEEARRHDGRPRRLAMRTEALTPDQIAALSPLRTVEIRSLQHVRNVKAADAAHGVTIRGGG